MTKQVNGKGFIFLTHTQNNKKDPLSFQDKLAYITNQVNDPNLQIGDPSVKTVIQALQKIQAQGRTRVVMIAGDDRVMEFQKFLNQYNGKADQQGIIPYKFDDVQVVSAGQRDPDADDITGASASKARDLALKGQWHEFSKIAMGGDKSQVLYNKIQDALGVQVAENNKKLYNENMADGKPIVYIDMDGVLADFFGGVEKLYGVQHWKDLSQDNKLDLKQEVINRIQGTDFFATLPKFQTADNLITMVKKIYWWYIFN